MKATPEDYLIAHTDGGARGNPGPAGFGVLIHDSKGNQVARLSQYLGRQTNNFAEYQALLAALDYAVRSGRKALCVVSDSELLVKQIRGVYQVRDLTLRNLHARAQELISRLEWFEITHVRRGENREADRLANEAMDQGSHTPPFRTPAPAPPAREFQGVVRGGKIELLDGHLPDGTRVEVRLKSS
jgi:ribonuclease HI